MTSNKELGRYPWQSPTGKPADTGQCEYPTPPVPLLRPVRECNESRHLYVGDCCEHGSLCPCHVHLPSQLFHDHSSHIFEWLQHRYEQAGYQDGPEPGTADYERAERNSYGASAVLLDEYEGE